MLERHTTRRRRSLRSLGRPIFRSVWPHSWSVLHGGSDLRPEDAGALLHLLSALQSELRVLVPAHLRKAAQLVIYSELDLVIFSVGVLITGSLEFNSHSPSCESCIVALMKCIYKLCLVYNCQKNKTQVVSSAKGCHFNGQGLMSAFFVSLKHHFGITYSF